MIKIPIINIVAFMHRVYNIFSLSKSQKLSGNANVSLASSIGCTDRVYPIRFAIPNGRKELQPLSRRVPASVNSRPRRDARGSARLMPPREKIERNATDPSYRPHPIGDDTGEEATTRGSIYIFISRQSYLISRIRISPIAHGIPRLRILISRGP